METGFSGVSVVTNPPANIGDAGSNPGCRKSPEEGMATHSSTVAWEIPWTKASGVHGVTRSQTGLD